MDYLPGWTLNDEQNSIPNDRVIIGNNDIVPVPDNSTTSFPYRMVCLILVQYNETPGVVYLGTGFLVGPSTIMTACHTIYHEDYGFFDSIQFGFGAYYNESTQAMVYPYGLMSSWNACTVGSYYDTYSANDDWAIIDLSTTPGSTLGYFGLTNNISNNNSVRTYGYPMEYTQDLAYSDGTISSLQTYMFNHNCDTTHGSSGGPICYNLSVCGIHHGGSDVSNINYACRISTYIIGWINERING